MRTIRLLLLGLLLTILGTALCSAQSAVNVSGTQVSEVSQMLLKSTGNYPTNSKVPVLFGWWMDTVGTTIDYKNSFTKIIDGWCLFYKVQIATDGAFLNVIYRDTLIQDAYDYRIYPTFAKRYAVADSLIPPRPVPDTTYYVLKPLMVAGNPDSSWSTKRNVDLWFRVNARWVQWFFWPNGQEWWLEYPILESAYTPGMRFKLGSVITVVNPSNLQTFILGNNYPNPINPTTTIPYHIPTTAHVNITVYDVLGRAVKVLINDYQQAGDYIVTWDATKVPTGTYFCRMQGASLMDRAFVKTIKMSVLR